MTGDETVDVEMAVGTLAGRSVLNIFLHHPDKDGRAGAEAIAYASGADYTFCPADQSLPMGVGCVDVRGSSLCISIGNMYIISWLSVRSSEIYDKEVESSVVYFVDDPLDLDDRTEKICLAIHLPLIHRM